MLKIGDAAPDFLLPSVDGKAISLKDFAKKKLILYFYPKDDTPGCTLEAKDFNNSCAEFKKANCEIVGISKDSVSSHGKFCKKYDLSIRLASDENKTTCEDYEVWVEKSFMGKKYMGIERSTFLINEEGKIANIWRNVKVSGHVEEVLKAAKDL